MRPRANGSGFSVVISLGYRVTCAFRTTPAPSGNTLVRFKGLTLTMILLVLLFCCFFCFFRIPFLVIFEVLFNPLVDFRVVRESFTGFVEC